MTYTADLTSTLFLDPTQLENAVDATKSLVKRLNIDDQLALLWYAYTKIGGSITPAAPGAARLQFAEGLLEQIKQMSHEEQLEAMRDLASGTNSQISRSYGILSNNTKLAFWYKLAEFMEAGIVVPVPAGYQASEEVKRALSVIERLEFNQQISVLRGIVADMGVDPLNV